MGTSLPHAGKNHLFGDTLTQIRGAIGGLDVCIETLETESVFFSHPQNRHDLNSIQESAKKLRDLAILLEKTPTDTDDSPAIWSKNRHDLRAYLGGIKGYTELMLEDMNESHGESVGAYLSDVIVAVDTILPMIDRIRFGIHQTVESEGQKLKDYIKTKYPSLILIIDDSPHKCAVLKRRLIQVGHRVLVAEDGLSGIELLQNQIVDLILLDILMPGINGYDVLKRIKENPKTAQIPVLMISSVSEIESVVRCIAAGADDYLPMPINPVVLHARINRCLERQDLARRERQTHLQLNETRLSLEKAIASIDDGFAIFDSTDHFSLCNKPFLDLYPTLIGKDLTRMSYRDFLDMNLSDGLYQEERRKTGKPAHNQLSDDFVPIANPSEWILKKMASHGVPGKPYLQRLSNNRWIEIIESTIPGGGTVAIHKNVTNRVLHDKRLTYLANHDPLTNLANRAMFDKKLSDVLNSAKKNNDLFALFYIDLDQFKKVNDTFGHDTGDFLLQQMAHCFEQSVRETDIVARLGGDEFCILMRFLETRDQATVMADRLLEKCQSPLYKDGRLIPFGISIGIALFPDHGITCDQLIKIADSAMYRAKKTGLFSYEIGGGGHNLAIG